MATWLFAIPYATGYGDDRVTLFTWLTRHWSRPDWQHGALVPLIAGWLVYRRRDALTSIPFSRSRWGMPTLVISFFILWVGYRANSYYFGYAGLQLLLAGLILWLAGGRHFRVLLFPWLFLSFTWPLIFLEDSLAFQLRVLVSEVSSGFLNLIGVDTLRSGTALVSAPDAAAGLAAGEKFSLGVDGPCSGMRSLFALLMISALIGHLTLEKNWKRLVFFALAFPMAILGNFVRIMILLVGVKFLGVEVAIGSAEGDVSGYHMMSGIAVFVVALGGMALLARLMKGEVHPGGGGDGERFRRGCRDGHAVRRRWCSVGSGYPFVYLAPAPARGDSSGVVMNLPRAVGDFFGVEGKPADVELELLPDDTQFAKMVYRRGHATTSPDVVSCSIVLSGADRRSIHRPEVCLTGQGWTIDSREIVPVEMADGRTFEVMDLLVSRMSPDRRAVIRSKCARTTSTGSWGRT